MMELGKGVFRNGRNTAHVHCYSLSRGQNFGPKSLTNLTPNQLIFENIGMLIVIAWSFYICNACGQNLANSESCLCWSLLKLAKINNLSKKMAMFQQLNDQLPKGSK